MSQGNNFLNSDPHQLEQVLRDTNRDLLERATSEKASSLHLPYVNLHNFPIDLQVLALFSKEEAESLGAIPFYLDQKDLRIGATNPNSLVLKEKLKDLSSKFTITLYLISESSLKQVIPYFAKVSSVHAAKDETIRVEESQLAQKMTGLSDVQEQKKLSTSQFLEVIFGSAMELKASDIHMEQEEHFVKMRLRIDGVLQDVLHIDKTVYKSILARIKIQSKVKLNVDNIPQDGRLTFYYLSKPVDVRVSLLPSSYGEGIVMRLLGVSATQLKLGDLGMQGKALQVVEQAIQKPNGMIITTGPTGSGKTTTLYAFLNELNNSEIKIITLEDPVEYKLEGIQQTPIDHTVNFDFATGLRAILRQDPDIVMVGEIRDLETADTACQAALTGHLVFSTLHTNDAAGAIPRLQNMGVKPFVLGPALSLVIAQRLVRKLCPECITPAVLSPQTMERVQLMLKSIPPQAEVKLPDSLQFYHSKGCKACHNLGYKGRMGVYEVIEVNDELRDLIQKGATTGEVKKVAQNQGSITMGQDGLLKALQKITDVEEVLRVVGE